MYEYRASGSTWNGDSTVYRRVLDAVSELPTGARLLDAGCGNGYLVSLLARRGFKTCGIDPSSSGIAVARESYPEIPFVCADFSQPPPGLAEFDGITCVEVLEHVHAPRQILRSLIDLLKPGGLLVLSTPYHGYLKNVAVALSGRFDKHFNPLWDDGHIKFFSYRTLCEALQNAGFERIRITGVGRVPYLWKSMVATARKPARPDELIESE